MSATPHRGISGGNRAGRGTVKAGGGREPSSPRRLRNKTQHGSQRHRPNRDDDQRQRPQRPTETVTGTGRRGRSARGYLQLKDGEKPTWPGLTIERRFTRPDVHPYDTVEWDLREATITNEHGKAVFEQKDLEFPKAWSALATNVVASKYFRGHLGTPERERSVKQMIDRVADTIADWGIKDAYFATDEDAEAFRNELKDILLKQRAAFNSPVWFNVGIDAHPQCSRLLHQPRRRHDGVAS